MPSPAPTSARFCSDLRRAILGRVKRLRICGVQISVVRRHAVREVTLKSAAASRLVVPAPSRLPGRARSMFFPSLGKSDSSRSRRKLAHCSGCDIGRGFTEQVCDAPPLRAFRVLVRNCGPPLRKQLSVLPDCQIHFRIEDADALHQKKIDRMRLFLKQAASANVTELMYSLAWRAVARRGSRPSMK